MLGSEAGGAYALVYACATIGDKACKGKGKSIRDLGGVPSPYHASQKDLRRVQVYYTCIDAASASVDEIGPPPRLR